MTLVRVALGLAVLAGTGKTSGAQCRPSTESNEARLLAFYSVPMAFSLLGAPEYLGRGALKVGGEIGPVPSPKESLRRTGACFTAKDENTKLTPVFGRPRVTIGLPLGFALSGSYLPPVTIGDATPNLGSLALSLVEEFRIGPWLDRSALMVRAHHTFGSVRGPITCPRKALQQTSASAPCHGTKPSEDTFRPNMSGVDGTLAVSSRNGAVGVYGGAGINWLRPRFQVGFTSSSGNVDVTRVEVDMTRLAVFAGATAHLPRGLDATAEIYSAPEDAVTVRFGGAIRVR